ncbi:MAG: hypothetical protein ACK5MJ_03595, partial [Alphaproteobacteria bacterium]
NATVTITGTYGTLTVTGNGDGTFSYKYELTGNAAHAAPPTDENLKDEFEITVSDKDSDADATGKLTIDVVDDVPVATEDGSVLIEVGNSIVSIDKEYNVLGNDVWGADGPQGGTKSITGTPTVKCDLNGDGTADDVTLSYVDSNDHSKGWTADINGGTLTIKPDGTVKFVATDGSEVSQDKDITINYTITDGDGDTDDATFTLDFTEGPGITIDPDGKDKGEPGTSDARDEVSESGLSNGSGEASDTIAGNDNSEFTDGDGQVGNISITNGSRVTIEGFEADGTTPKTYTFPSSGSIEVYGEHGKLTITYVSDGEYSYKYELTENINHSDANPDKDVFNITVFDSNNKKADGTLTIDIVDDKPDAVDDGSHKVDINDPNNISDFTHNVLTNDRWGADDKKDDGTTAIDKVITGATAKFADGTEIKLGWVDPSDHSKGWTAVDNGGNAISVNGGTLVVKPDGTVTFTDINGTVVNQADDITVTYTITDNDGSTDTADITINFDGTPKITVDPDPEDPSNPTTSSGSETVYESGMSKGSEASTDKEFAEGSINTEFAESVTINGTTLDPSGTVTISGSYGLLTVTGNGDGTFSYKYELKNNAEHPATGDILDEFKIVVTDVDGETANGSLNITIKDDVPIATDDLIEVNISSGGAINASGNILFNDHWYADDGGDKVITAIKGITVGGVAVNASDITGDATNGWTVSIKGGTLTIKPDGTVSFKVDATAAQNITQKDDIIIKYEITDSDGDKSEADAKFDFQGETDITVDPDPDPDPDTDTDLPEADNGSSNVYEKGLDAHGTEGAGNTEVTTGKLNVKFSDSMSLTYTDKNSVDHTISFNNLDSLTVGSSDAITTEHGKLTVTYNGNGQFTYSYELTKEASHSGGDVSENFVIKTTGEDDINGNPTSDEGNLTINIIDDVPIVTGEGTKTIDLSDLATAGATYEYTNVLSDDVWGADQPTAPNQVITGIVITLGGQTVNLGSGWNASTGWSGTVNGGTLTITPAGKVTWTASAGATVDDSKDIKITYTIKDSDGDTASGDITLNFGNKPGIIVDPDPDPSTGADNDKNSVYEAGLDQAGTDYDGTDKESDTEFTTGTVTVTDAESVEFSFGGTTVTFTDLGTTGVNTVKTVDTPLGLLTITYKGNGEFGYTYTLQKNTGHADGNGNNEVTEEFGIKVIGADLDGSGFGSESTGNITIHIVDDVPKVTSEADQVINIDNLDTTAINYSFSGTLLDNDLWGADGAKDLVGSDGKGDFIIETVTLKVGGSAHTITWSSSTGWSGTVNGGTLTITPDGKVTWKADAGATVNKDNDIEISYTIKDSDGDTATGSMKIDFQGTPDITIDPGDSQPTGDNVSDKVYESGLDAHGTDGTADSEKTTGTFNVDQANSVAINFPGGTPASISFADLSATGNGTSHTITTSLGVLTVTYVGDGKFSYTYELKSNAGHAAPPANTDVNESFTITVTGDDNNGDSIAETHTGTLNIAIVDDAPQAANDKDQVITLSKTGAISWTIADADNLLKNDVWGADQPTSKVITEVKVTTADGVVHTLSTTGGNFTLSVNGGTLTVKPDGTVSFTASDGSQVKGDQDFVIHYTIKDSDGDTSTADVNINFKGDPTITVDPDPDPEDNTDNPPAGANVIDNVHESGLDQSGASKDGTEMDKDREFTTGKFSVDYAEKVTISIGGTSITFGDMSDTGNGTVKSIDTPYGKITITYVGNGEFSYSYQLEKNYDHTQSSPQERFDITVQGEDGATDTSTGSLTINIVDDAPIATDDGTHIIEVGSEGSLNWTYSGNLLTNDLWGADGIVAKGDTSSTTKTIYNVTVTYGASNTSVTMTWDATNHLWKSGLVNGGYLTVKADGTVSFTASDGTAINQDNDITITYTIKDGDTDTDTGKIVLDFKGKPDVTIDPDGSDPAVDNATNQVYESGLNAHGSEGTTDKEITKGVINVANGNKLEITMATGTPTSIVFDNISSLANGASRTIDTPLGKLVVTFDKASGTFTYEYTLETSTDHPTTGNITEDFHVTITGEDTDGDSILNTDTGTLTINVVDDVPTAKSDGTIKIDCGGYDNGAFSWTITDKLIANDAWGADQPAVADQKITGVTVTLSDGTLATPSFVGGVWTLNVNNGILKVSPDGTVTFTADDASKVDQSKDIELHYTITDKDGDTSTMDVPIDFDNKPNVIVDPDNPSATDATNSVDEKGLEDGTGELADGIAGNNSDTSEITTGSFSLSDATSGTIAGHNLVWNGSTGQIDTGKGILVVTGDGTGNFTYTYTLKDNQDHSSGVVNDVITITARDGDGDVDSGTITINVIDDEPIASDDYFNINMDDPANGIDGNVVIANNDGTTIVYQMQFLGNDLWGADGGGSGVAGTARYVEDITNVKIGDNILTLTMTEDLLTGGKSWDAYIYEGSDRIGRIQISATGGITLSLMKDLTSTIDQYKDITFTYTIKDGDGDTSKANVVIDLDKKPTLTLGNRIVYEAGLDQGHAMDSSYPMFGNSDVMHNNAGSDHANNSNVATGVIQVTDAQTVTIAGITLSTTNPTLIMGKYGTLIVTYDSTSGNFKYTYELTTSVNHVDDYGNMVERKDDFVVVVTDKDTLSDEHNKASDTLSITVVDDSHTPNLQGENRKFGSDSLGDTIRINFLKDALYNADGVAVTEIQVVMYEKYEDGNGKDDYKGYLTTYTGEDLLDLAHGVYLDHLHSYYAKFDFETGEIQLIKLWNAGTAETMVSNFGISYKVSDGEGHEYTLGDFFNTQEELQALIDTHKTSGDPGASLANAIHEKTGIDIDDEGLGQSTWIYVDSDMGPGKDEANVKVHSEIDASKVTDYAANSWFIDESDNAAAAKSTLHMKMATSVDAFVTSPDPGAFSMTINDTSIWNIGANTQAATRVYGDYGYITLSYTPIRDSSIRENDFEITYTQTNFTTNGVVDVFDFQQTGYGNGGHLLPMYYQETQLSFVFVLNDDGNIFS